MVSPVHDDDTDYSDLDEEAPPSATSSQRPSGPKTRERLSERAPLLSRSPPPPAYADVTRLYGTPPYVSQNAPTTARQYQPRRDDATEPADGPSDQSQSMSDPGRDPEDGKKTKRKRNVLYNKKTLGSLVLILAVSLVLLVSMSTTRHDKSSDEKIGDGSETSPGDEFPHSTRCVYQSISDKDLFAFDTAHKFSFVEITEGAHMPSANINGQIHLLMGEKDQKAPVLTEMRVAKSSDAQKLHLRIDYTAESLRLNAPAASDDHSNACMEINMNIWLKPGAQFEHLEFATEHLDINIEPGLFPSSGDDVPSYISNTTDFIAVSGSLSSAYWESGRETRIDLVSGSINGRFALRDLLSVKTKSGSINIDVKPKPASPVNPKPADFFAETVSGGIKAIFPVSNAVEEIPARWYHTKLESHSGSIRGSFIHGINTDISTASGSIDVNVLPYSANSTGSWFRTESQGGSIRATVLAPYEDPQDQLTRLRSVHKTKSGSVHVVYPQQWEGKIEAVTMTGSVKLRGKDVEILKQWKGPVGAHIVAQKGEGSSAMDLGTTSGSVDVTVGDLY